MPVDDLVRDLNKFPQRPDPLTLTTEERREATKEQIHLSIALSDPVRTAIRNNGGGHANHTAFWRLMGKVGSDGVGGAPTGPIAAQITADFGDFEAFKKTFNETTAKQFGSGWGWLVFQAGKLKVITTPNQDSPLTQGLYPILLNDIWEHAYYLKYQNRRPDYLAAWWNVVNWHEVNKRFAVAKG
jgi:Fe-Mn family superoxide dismutase